jgi:uncharacterized protein (TIGR02246 family)
MSHAFRALVLVAAGAAVLSSPVAVDAAASTPAAPQTAAAKPAATQPASANADAVRQREQQRVDALVAGDIEKAAAMMSPSLTYSHSNGTVNTKDEFMASLRSKQTVYKSVKHGDIAVRFPSPDVAILNGVSDFVVAIGGQEQQIPLRFTMVYARKGGEWLLEAWHSARRTP